MGGTAEAGSQLSEHPGFSAKMLIDPPWIAQREAAATAATQPAQVDVRIEGIAGMGKVAVRDKDDGQVRPEAEERDDEDKANVCLLGSCADCARSRERAVPDGRALIGRSSSGCKHVHADLSRTP